ncbi:hypothetical protein PACTADRAFT_2257 [Pachysolen tannophilus NRRL Y-2460]|uniref:Ketoreductase domain-containing protein n=1 Tax=Pachysolen tannophilus NRRL Y-2460 TaxID=669874 RepID=A0A1E4TW48_PACTA|nr:hypothetical protein PACTADRAFT_2257 [Pachysolen tannophilus NRRL Y-2460]
MSTDTLRFDNKVVIITGAGGGLGKTYALLFASRGAKVVVNDLGGSLAGSGTSNKAADLVVKEIEANGGIAAANYDNIVTNPDGILKTAIDNFGTVHILINNAGILKDSSFAKMSESAFSDVVAVHLEGSFKLTKLCWPYFRNQNYGRIINTASPAGLYGNFGQANYSAAKLGLVGLSETLAKEGFKYNIKCNAIAPIARSRMTENLLPPNILEKLSPNKISPLVAYLGHSSNEITGAIFEVAAGFFGQIRWERSGGVYFKPNDSFTPEAILNKFKDILIFDAGTTQHPKMLNDYNKIYETTSKFEKDNDQGKEKIDLKGKVVIITGAGSGLGKSHALFYAKYGAKVVVNDFRDPESCCNEINARYGNNTAVPAKCDVFSEPETIVDIALNHFGRIDILVNNAGILRDRSFGKMSDKEWSDVLNIHLFGTFKLTKLCWPIFLKQKFGRIINTTSTSGIYGNFGQANYAAAKAAILGLSRTLAIEGAKHNIITNVIAPHAETSMTKTIFEKNELNKFEPTQVSPLLIVLSMDKVPVIGELFEIGAGWIGNTRWQRAKGVICHDQDISIEFVANNIDKITDFTEGTLAIKSIQESSMSILTAVDSNNGGDDNEDDDDEDDDENDEDEDEDEENNPGNDSYHFNHRQVILYNISVGATAKDLQYVYENDAQFKVLPSFGVIPFMNQEDGGLNMPQITKNFNPMALLHGEHYLKLNQFPIPTSGTLITKSFPIAVIDKGKNCVIVAGYETLDQKTQKVLFYNEASYFVRNCSSKTGQTKFFKKREEFASKMFNAPSGTPYFESEYKTSPDQASIYRLNGDFNPLHIDPVFANGAHFQRPILHGLASFGISCKILYEKFGSFNQVKLRFSNIVYPGETLLVKAWRDSADKTLIIWETWSLDRNCRVISNAGLRLLESKQRNPKL